MLAHDKPLSFDHPIPKSELEKLQGTINSIREDVWIALQLLENPVFSNDTERALGILRAITNEL